MKALEDANGVDQDMWISILNTMGDQDPAVQSVCTYGGRHYVTEAQRKRLQQMLPFMKGQPLALPAPTTSTVDNKLLNAGCLSGPDRCGHCKGPFHPATGHAFSETIVCCGVCYGRFVAWQIEKNNWTWHTRPLNNRQLRKLDKKKKKAAKAEEKAAKQLVKQLAKEAAEKEKLYGKPRDAQPAYPLGF